MSENSTNSSYAARFSSAAQARDYEHGEYAPDSYSSWIWQLQQPFVSSRVASLKEKRPSLRLLDFACGTGRILAALEPLATQSIGLDISSEMLTVAKTKCHRSEFIHGNLLANPQLIDGSLDVVTMFRFILNAGPDISLQVLKLLHPHLASARGLIIANIHGNSWSLRRFALAAHRLRNRRNAEQTEKPMLEQMSPPQIRRLFAAAGYQVVVMLGFGLFPRSFYRSPAGRFCRAYDRMLAGNNPAKWFSTDLLFVCQPKD